MINIALKPDVHKPGFYVLEDIQNLPESLHLRMGTRSHVWRPPTDVLETEEAVVVRVEIAGMLENDFSIVIDGRYLSIRGQRSDVLERRAYHQMEIRFGKFITAIGLPTAVNVDEARAEYKDGFLTDHGPEHVKTVARRAADLLHYPEPTFPQLTPYEVYLLLLAIHFHDVGNLYVLDAPSRAVWVYAGMDSAFVDRPYFFFTEQIPEIQDSIDLVVKDDSLYLLHADGHLSTCSYSRIQTVPTRCQDPAQLINPYPAYKDVDLFAQAHITQMMYTAPPDSTILLLGADSQGVLRLTPASLELQGQIRPPAGKANPLPPGPVDAMAAGPNHVLYLAVKDQVYFAQNMP